jgi:NTE family protein
MVHDVALVLGGGGAAGQAWQIGVIAGLAEAGLDLTEAADLVVGTSSGSTTAAQVRSGIPAAELLASVLSPPVQPGGQNRERPPSLPMATVFERIRAIGAAATSAADLRRAMGAFGLESDSILGPEAGQRRAMVAARLPRAEWPDRPMIVVAVDAHTGELAARYINGGVRSGENADLASGYANVVVLSPFGGQNRTPPERGTGPAGQFEGLRKFPAQI